MLYNRFAVEYGANGNAIALIEKSRMKKLGSKVTNVVILGLFGLLCFAYRQFAINMEMDWTLPVLFISTGSGTGNQAHFVTSGF